MVNFQQLRVAFKKERRLLSLNPPLEEKDELQESEGTVWSGCTFGACLILSSFLLIGGCRPAHAAVNESDAIKILVGEASNQGFKGMVCVAEVLRTRGSIKGFYGLNAKHSSREPKWVWEQARKAWLASAKTNYTKGANHFENIVAFGCPTWVKSCVETFRHKDHVFYREAA